MKTAILAILLLTACGSEPREGVIVGKSVVGFQRAKLATDINTGEWVVRTFNADCYYLAEIGDSVYGRKSAWMTESATQWECRTWSVK